MDSQRRAWVVRWMVALNLVALTAAYISGQWDAAEHALGQVDQFWYPPHYGIYFGIFTAAMLSFVCLVVFLRSPAVIGVSTLRSNAALVMVVVANILGFTGAPFDAWWHSVYGIDLSVWSPPHIHLLFGLVLVTFACSVYFLDPSSSEFPLGRFTLNGRSTAAVYAIFLGVLLSAYLFFEYESGLANFTVFARPLWTYPVLFTMFVGFVVALPVSALRFKGAATVIGAAYLLARVLVVIIDRSILGFWGAVPYPLLIPAVVFDLGLIFAWSRWGGSKPWAAVAGVGVISSLSVILTAPFFWSWLGILPSLNADPWSAYWVEAIPAGVFGAIAGWWSGRMLRRLIPSEISLTEHVQVAVQAPAS